ncbi:MAG: hypothetical protein HYU68_11095, partial [Bacteroidetes bacterium]|nr:hypothetical protein [Bacteroidota bacterium]
MKNILFFIFLMNSLICFGQIGGTTCSGMAPICTSSGLQFTANSGGVPDVHTSEPGNDYGCLGTSPNPSWYYFEISQAGDIIMSLTAPNDIDFIIWGPYPNLAAAQTNCGSHTNIVPNVGPFLCDILGTCDSYGCSYSTSASETPGIPNAQVGQVYVMLITNYDNSVQNITLTQTGGTGATDCSIVTPCSISALTSVPGACQSATNTYTVNGDITFTNAPATGTLTVTDCHGNSQVFNAPFTSPQAYSIA